MFSKFRHNSLILVCAPLIILCHLHNVSYTKCRSSLGQMLRSGSLFATKILSYWYRDINIQQSSDRFTMGGLYPKYGVVSVNRGPGVPVIGDSNIYLRFVIVFSSVKSFIQFSDLYTSERFMFRNIFYEWALINLECHLIVLDIDTMYSGN